MMEMSMSELAWELAGWPNETAADWEALNEDVEKALVMLDVWAANAWLEEALKTAKVFCSWCDLTEEQCEDRRNGAHCPEYGGSL